MQITLAQLRKMVRESLAKHMKEQDKTGDGVEDFDDVRFSRYVKGGMTQKQAMSKIDKRPMGKGEGKRGRK